MIFLHPVGYDDVDLFKDSSYSTMPHNNMHQMISESIAKIHNGNYFGLFAVMDDMRCVGFVSMYGHSDTEISCGPEIKPQYREQGFAYYAVKQALEYAKRIGFIKAVAQVRKDNFASVALHKKLGFDVCKEYTNKKGNPVFWFEKSL